MCVIKKTISATSVTSHTHESKMAMYCFGCGCDITDLRVKRSSYSDASEHVRPLWCETFEKELVIKGIEVQAQRLITSESNDDHNRIRNGVCYFAERNGSSAEYSARY